MCFLVKKKVSYSVCNLLFFLLFTSLQILINLTSVKFSFALLQGQIAACKMCIKFEVASPGTAHSTEVSSSEPSACEVLFSFACSCFLRFCYEKTVS